jgi:sec-independent protein translocase protein TatC
MLISLPIGFFVTCLINCFAESICVTDMPFIIQNTNMEGQINVLIWTCITARFILGFPFILWEVWKFISPALYEKKKRKTFIVSFFTFLLEYCLAILLYPCL